MEVGTPQELPSFYNDPFNPLLFDVNTQAVTITVEQENLVRQVLLLSSSDTRFAQKAADALRVILLGGATGAPVIPPNISSLEPSTKPVGSPTFKLKTKGTGFKATDVIHVNGNAVTTLYVSATELNTDVSLVSVTQPTTIPVTVRTAEGVLSNTVILTVTAVATESVPVNVKKEKEK